MNQTTTKWRADPLTRGHGPRLFEMFLEPTYPFSVRAFGKLDGLIGMGLFATAARALFAVALVEIGIGIARPMFWTMPPLFLSRGAVAGAIALISVFANFGGITGPVVIGWLKTTTNSFSAGPYYVACCAFVASIAILSLRVASYVTGVPATER
jgi:hypothetical protein